MRARHIERQNMGATHPARHWIAEIHAERNHGRAWHRGRALKYALPIIEKYAHTQGDNAAFHAEITAPIRSALSQAQPQPSDEVARMTGHVLNAESGESDEMG
jgi:hypothetical protein